MTGDRLARMRQALLRMVVGVVLIDLVVVGLLFLTDLRNDPVKSPILLGVWMIATLLVVLPPLRTIRRIRREPE